MGFMAVVGARKESFSFLIDFISLDVSDSTNDQIGSVGVNTHIDLQGLVLTPVVGFQFLENDTIQAEVIAGARYLGLDTDLKFRNADLNATSFNKDASKSGDNWDAIIGLRGQIHFASNWYIPLQIDIGAGDSEFTWQFAGGVAYQFKYCDVVVAYRYLSWDFDDNDVFDDLNFSGPMAGLKFSF